MTVSPEVLAITDLEDLQEQLNEVYLPSRAIPGKTVTRLSEEFYSILDWFAFITAKANFSMWDLADVESAPREALIAMCLEFDLPVPDFAADEQIRDLAREAGEINKFRNTIRGWEQYLTAISPDDVTAVISIDRFTARIFYWGTPGFMFPNEDILVTYQTPDDSIAYLWSPETLEVTVVISITGTSASLTDDFKEFVRQTPRYFVPVLGIESLLDIHFLFTEI